jgi:hypothetical protein
MIQWLLGRNFPDRSMLYKKIRRYRLSIGEPMRAKEHSENQKSLVNDSA